MHGHQNGRQRQDPAALFRAHLRAWAQRDVQRKHQKPEPIPARHVAHWPGVQHPVGGKLLLLFFSLVLTIPRPFIHLLRVLQNSFLQSLLHSLLHSFSLSAVCIADSALQSLHCTLNLFESGRLSEDCPRRPFPPFFQKIFAQFRRFFPKLSPKTLLPPSCSPITVDLCLCCNLEPHFNSANISQFPLRASKPQASALQARCELANCQPIPAGRHFQATERATKRTNGDWPPLASFFIKLQLQLGRRAPT